MERHWEYEDQLLKRSVWIELRGGWGGWEGGQRGVEKGEEIQKIALECGKDG